MKKIFFLALFLLLFAFSAAQASESIDNFAIDIVINKDSSLQVAETITYDFAEFSRHGIYRDIPYKYHVRGSNYKLNFTDIDVVDEFGRAYPFTVSHIGRIMRVKIGDPNLLVRGKKVYVIKYKVKGVINYFSDYDELYWNITGNDWSVPIKKVSAYVHLPSVSLPDDLRFKCFVGSAGSNKSCASTQTLSGEIFFSANNLQAREGLTIVAGWPKGLVYEPQWWEVWRNRIADNYILLLPLLVLFVMLWLWNSRGRDPKGRGVIIPRYSPPSSLTPAEVGTIIDERVDRMDISAIIIDLAVRGYIKITRIEKKTFWGKNIDYRLEQLRPADDSLKDFETILLEGLFQDKTDVASYIGAKPHYPVVNLSDLKEKFHKTVDKIRKKLYSDVSLAGYFTKNPKSVRVVYKTISGIFLVIGFPAGIFFGPLSLLAFPLSGVIVLIFSLFMPQKTKKGVKSYEHILGLKEYLSVAEKDRIKFHNAPEKNPKLFEKLLPYAMVLKVEREWAEQFKEIYKQPPSWYDDPSGSGFSTVLLANNLHSFSTTASSVLNSRPSSAAAGGSGFSGGGVGGGFGGGGGGSW